MAFWFLFCFVFIENPQVPADVSASFFLGTLELGLKN